MSFFELSEQKLWKREDLLFDEGKIKKFLFEQIFEALNKRKASERGFYFEKIAYDFFRYRNYKLTKTKKTRDFGIDGTIETKLEPFGRLRLGLQIKYKKIGSPDIDKFIQALNYAELRLGIIACKEARRLDKYGLSSKLKALLFPFGKQFRIEESRIEKLNLNPIFILKIKDIIDICASHIRAAARGIYKK